MAKTDWYPYLHEELEKPYWQELQAFLKQERATHTVYPPVADEFNALHYTSFENLKVVILGQDPYHQPGQAHGLCFSVKPPTAPPPSLVNIYKELEADLGIKKPSTGSLIPWTQQGVFLLNTTLTVRANQPASHQGKGWETFTNKVIETINLKPNPVVYILWGSSARAKKKLITNTQHVVIESAHPSPLSSYRGFFGSKPFSRTNKVLETAGIKPINWELD